MTLQTTAPIADYIENGVTLVHAIPFQFLASTDIVCSRIAGGVESELTLGADYTVSGGDGSSGSVTKANGGVNGTIFRIRRQTTRAQPTDYTPGDAFPAETHEAALDRLAAVNQEQDVAIEDLESRALRFPAGELAQTLPPKAVRAGKFQAYDAQGNLIAAAGSGNDPNLRSDLAQPNGPDLIGFAAGVDYDPASVGAALIPPGTALADVAIAAGKLVNLYWTGGALHMRLADGSDPTKPAHAFCPAAVSIGVTGLWRRRGIIPGTQLAAFAADLWLSDTSPGAYQSTPPSTAGHISQHVGIALTGVGVEFNPDPEIQL